MSGLRAGIVVAGIVALGVATQALAEKTTEGFANGTTRPQSVAPIAGFASLLVMASAMMRSTSQR